MRRRAVSVTTLAIAAATAMAFNTIDYGGAPAKWPNARATVYHDPSWTGFPSYVSELRAAMSVWSGVQGSNFVYFAAGSSPSTNLLDTTNGNSDVYFSSGLSPGAWAVTYLTLTGPAIWDRDVAFNVNHTWSTTGSGGADFRSVAVHEFGHVLGLDHESVNPAVMHPIYDGVSLKRLLSFDDQEGCRFIYPEPPPPPPPPDDADLLIENVTLASADVEAGDEIRVSFTMRNVGTDPTGTFAATVYLVEGGGVTPDDRYLRAAVQSGLDAGATRDATVSVRLPDVLEPRIYRIGVILDAQQAVYDRDRSNNSGVAAQLIEGGGDALVIGLGTRVTGEVISFGNASFAVDLTAGTKLRVRAALDAGSLRLQVMQESNGTPLLDQLRYRRAKGKVTVPADGRYLIQITNDNPGVTPYELRLGAKTIRHDGRLMVGLANQLQFPGYMGATVDVKIRSKSDARPTAEWVELQTPLKTNRKGTKLKLAAVRVPSTGTLVLGMGRGEGPSGEVSYRVRLKIPKKGPLIRR